ncbi:sorbosone dehydrogenase family protein [Altererythrobacter sp. KTW20L]|nr:sorbosone dehydrogenase family protein [Altererythrobacter sp. KTW20L]
MKRIVLSSIASLALAACGSGADEVQQTGAVAEMPDPDRGLLPSMNVADPTGWGDRRPRVPEGFTVTAIATDMAIPRQSIVLPNGDILVAEGMGGGAPALRPKDIIASYIKSQGTSSVEGGDRLTLLRDADGDGTYETRSIFAADLNAPYGLALIDDRLFVANQDAIVVFDYQPGQTVASGPPRRLAPLPSEVNHHWTKAMTASADGQYLYVGIGSNSNIGERGMAIEEERAMVWQVDVATGAHRRYATGLRNPTALAIQPGTGQLWAVVNERDEMGPDVPPDYLTSVRAGGFYGWPYAYWGTYPDRRVRPFKEDMVARSIRPDYSLGAHVAALGVDFSSTAMGAGYAEGVFVGMHGSWNRKVPVGYKVVFVPFRNGRPAGDPVDFVTGFHVDGETYGRPVGVTVDPAGALIVADDLSNTVWRITRNAPPNLAPSPAEMG